MRRRAWVALGCLAAAIGLGLLGRAAPPERLWNLLSGLLLLAAAIVGLTLLGLGRRLVPGLDPIPGLFDRPRPNERWCATCGHPTGRDGPCRHCGDAPASRGTRRRT